MASDRKAKNRRREILRCLDRGVDEFNAWRARHPGVHIELDRHDFRGRNLSGVDLHATKLKGANFSGCVLHKADFRGANLNGAHLVGAELRGADLCQARLAGADLSGAVLDEANLYATIRDGWRIAGVVCERCWIRTDRQHDRDSPDVFEAGEFEVVYGGRRIRVRFPGGFQPIDLVALPFHAQALLERHRNQRIVLVGMSTVGEAALEFRLEDTEPTELEKTLQESFTNLAPAIRLETNEALTKLVAAKDEHLRDQRKFLDVLSALVLRGAQSSSGETTQIIVGSVQGDLNAAAAAGALGRYASADQITYTTVWNELSSAVDVELLQRELGRLSAALVGASRPREASEVTAAVGELQRGNGPRALALLKKAGTWALDTATSIGTEVAAAVIKQSTGVP